MVEKRIMCVRTFLFVMSSRYGGRFWETISLGASEGSVIKSHLGWQLPVQTKRPPYTPTQHWTAL